MPVGQSLDQPVTITFVPEQIITWLIIGLVAGFLASLLVRGKNLGATTSIIIGLVGALVGGFLFTVFQIPVAPALLQGITIRYIDVIVSFIGAVIVLLIVTILRRR
jgi:uncharacterized membrane protein YeaQ/YmgE (transglycosylase-associated protein family)